ncbi:MAG: hypothetical protein L6R42_000709 [Xanthoria sp. 1 TBL-2021]|nr:MAG: hypothetical protein L6R42_000709 [Xanthoria sp. 1 TBL-2021]
MTLEDFEKSLAEERRIKEREENGDTHFESRKRRKHNHHQHRHRDDGRHRRSKHPNPDLKTESRSRQNETTQVNTSDEGELEWIEKDVQEPSVRGLENTASGQPGKDGLKRDSWMEESSPFDIEFSRRGTQKPSGLADTTTSKADFQLKIHNTELNKHNLQELADGKEIPEDVVSEPAKHMVEYVFGDSGAPWRMTKLKAVYRRAEESGVDVEAVAAEQYGDLRAFDDAREEETELERRKTYGEGYVGKEKPSGELFQERKLEMGVHEKSDKLDHVEKEGPPERQIPEAEPTTSTARQLDQTTLNRLKAQMMKAKLKGSVEASRLEAEYNEAMKSAGNPSGAATVILGAMDNRMLAGGRNGEVKAVGTKRGRERGLIEENEDMSVEDMVKQERRTRNQPGGDGQRFAERIAKDAKFDSDLDYMDKNAGKLAKRVQKSEINLRNTAISDFQKMNRILDNCPLCHHEDSNTPPAAPVVSLATRVYLTLPTEPEISDGGACIIPIQHRGNLLECDEDEWEEIRNFMKSLTRMYHDQGRDIIFYENAAAPHRKKHAGMEAVPLPYSLGETAPAFFKEAILAADEEWTQHKKLLDTLAKAKQGLGKLAFRRTLAKEMPYFHVWFEIDGGLGHVVEDANRWPKGDLFAREIIGGMLDKGPDVIKKQGKWNRGGDHRIEGFRKRWRKFDWTRVLTDS